MKFASVLASAIALASLVPVTTAHAFGLVGPGREQSEVMDGRFIRERDRSVEPFAHVMFCTRLPQECAGSTGPDSVEYSREKRRELLAVNREVNTMIRPVHDVSTARSADVWSLNPKSGDCEDYAISKRHALIQKGWPPAALRLAIAHTSWGEGHLVLVVRTSKGDMVLDSLTNAVRDWRRSGLRWQLIQASGNPRLWHKI